MNSDLTPEKQISDSKTIISSVLNLDIHPEMKKRVIRLMIWNITGANHKTFYISDQADKNKTVRKNREHVYKIKSLIDKIINNRSDLEDIFESAIICIVTEEEHKKLNQIDQDFPELDGWSRYEKAKIEVKGYTIENGKLYSLSDINAK